MPSPPPAEPMDVTTPTGSSAPPSATKSPDRDVKVNGGTADRLQPPPPQQEKQSQQPAPENANTASAATAATTTVHQPKVQTAFIHKLWSMLEDPKIQHLISWTPNADSFVIQPSHEFSKVLAQYFKHTNISSFVRQLNMYGFHKVSDVFAHGTPDSTLWEFKHGNGNFKRGDMMGLREIRRRASRATLGHREYNNQRAPPSQPGTPAEPVAPMQDATNPRLNSIEHTLFDLSTRLQRYEEHAQIMQVKYQAVMDTVTRLLQFNQDLSRAVLALAPLDSPMHRDAEVQRQMDIFRSIEDPHDPALAGRQQYFSKVENAPVSPRQLPQDDPRRNTLAVPQPRHPNYQYRPSVPSNLSVSSRRPYGSIGGNATQSSPSSLRVQPPPPPPPGPHALANVELPPGNLGRRHTSADIRAHGWQPNPPPFASGPPSGPWPSSPNRLAPQAAEDQRIRDSFSHYSLQPPQPHSRPTTPPPPLPHLSNGGPPPPPPAAIDTFGSWSWNSAANSNNRNLMVKDHSAPPTRRGSMAHILNPADPADRIDEDSLDPRGEEDRKRKRLQ
ncbi:hypothetical protein VTJ49DRAFT_613 [Mycothermus thermophilus]|uniref:HSF-type DNA-binding domain-containing protein n=1 Tax=Humicola insolens TaxID=85995 RepID=A0ABR3VRE5_HUMIN